MAVAPASARFCLMAGIVCRMTQSGIESAIPKGLLSTGSTYAAIGFLERCHARLIAEPDAFGYNPQASYLIFVQTWDRAEQEVRSLAFGRTAIGQHRVRLIPDPYFINSEGYQSLRHHAEGAALPPWQVRQPGFAWRGSLTWPRANTPIAEMPRVRLALACRDMAGTDVAIFAVHPTMRAHYAIPELERFIQQAGIWGERWSVSAFGKYKFTIDIDGHANAWGLLEKLILGCCVLKVASPYEQWYYHRLHPWKHYVPIRSDFGDLAEKLAWCQENQGECAWIAHNGTLLARALTMEATIHQACRDIAATASVQR